MTLSRTGASLALAITMLSVRELGSQQSQLIEAGVRAPRAAVEHARPSAFDLTAKSLGWSAYGSILGALVGLEVDDASCKRHHRGKQGFLFGPCFLYASDGFGTGWFGGGIAGATFGAVRIAEKRGCPRSSGIGRAMMGALLASAPGVIMAADRSGKYGEARSALIAAGPLLSGLGAAVAVVGCNVS